MDPTPNIPLLRKVVEWVEEQAALPDEKRSWHQDVWAALRSHSAYEKSWSCETAMCLAGKVALDNGWRVDPLANAVVINEKSGQRSPVWKVADDLLGLDEFHMLYEGENDAADIRRIAEEIAGERL